MIDVKKLFQKIKKSDVWFFRYKGNLPDSTKTVFIEGLPGIGNVGKIAVDFLIDELNAKKFLEINSNTFPHSVFVNENNVVELPKVELFYKKIKNVTYIFMSGDIQPSDEMSCYEFSRLILDFLKQVKCKEIVTLGGMGLNSIKKKPKLYCTGNNSKIIEEYKLNKNISSNLYGVIGPIMGVSGLLVALAQDYSINGVCILAETLNHPLYLGIKSAKEIVKLLAKKHDFDVKTKKLDKEIKSFDTNMMISSGLNQNDDSKESNISSYIG